MSMYTRTRNIRYREKSVNVRKHILLFLYFAKKGFGTRDSYKTIIKIRKSYWHDVNAFQNDSTQKTLRRMYKLEYI